MAKWNLLKSILTSGRDPQHAGSIHADSARFSFQVDGMRKTKVIWPGFVLTLASGDVQALKSACKAYVQRIDCPDFDVRVAPPLPAADLLCLPAALAELQMRACVTCVSTEAMVLHVTDTAYVPQLASAGLFVHRTPLLAPGCGVYTREPLPQRRLKADDVLSNQRYGVDNTGNICVWPAEGVLLAVLLGCPALRAALAGAAVLELGGGMTALAGLGLAVSGLPREVLLSDGHPRAAANQQVCLEMTRSMGSLAGSNTHVSCRALQWSDCCSLSAGSVDMVIAADCLFFEGSGHADLLALLAHALSPRGMAVLLQPRRSGSMDRFVRLAQAQGFAAEVSEDYHPLIAAQRLAYADAEGYRDDLHFPVLVTVRRPAQLLPHA